MKKTLLLSVVASTMIMAGGDIAPVEPVVETPVVAAASGWDFGGQSVAYIQTTDALGQGDLFTGNDTYSSAGLQLRATNKDIFAGIGAGVELSAIGQDRDISNKVGRGTVGNSQEQSSGLTQAYLTYAMGNTSIKVGRQTLPKSLSPFAFSEGWQVFKNTFDAALVVNSDLPDTTLVYAAVTKRNNSVGPALDASSFTKFYSSDVVHMITAQNKSIDGLTLTGSYYLLPDATGAGDANAIWGDAKFKISDYSIALQGGTIGGDAVPNDTTAFGAKIAGNFGMFGASLAYSTVDDGTLNIANLAGAGVKTPLYTQAILNQNSIKRDADTIKVAASMKALGGKFGLAYITADMGTSALGSVFMPGTAGAGTYQEIDATYKTKISDNTTLFAAYVYQNDDRINTTLVGAPDDTQNFVRFWARYSF